MTPSPAALEKARALVHAWRSDLDASLADLIAVAITEARAHGFETAAQWHEGMAVGALSKNHDGSTNSERRDNRAIADWHTTCAAAIRARSKEGRS